MFLTFALVTLVGALAMSRQKNLIVAGLCLVLSFIGMAGIFLLLSNPVAAALQVIGVDRLQGYLFSRPQSSAELDQWVWEKTWTMV